jgi:hypothetical protein
MDTVDAVDVPCTTFVNIVVFWLINSYFMILYDGVVVVIRKGMQK